jgi:hypothetical protein
MGQIASPLAHLKKYGVANLDTTTLNHLFQRANQNIFQLEAMQAEMGRNEFQDVFAATFVKDLEDAQQAIELIEDFRNGRPVPEAEEAPAPVEAEPVKPVYLLEHLRRKGYEAYSNISHVPEKRAETVVKEYSAELEGHLATLTAAEVPEEKIAEYRQGYEEHLRAYLSAKSRTASSMITGPANFPVERNRKRMNSERKRYEEFEEYCRKFIKRALSGPRVPRTPTSELEKCQAKLAGCEANHELMLTFNKLLRKTKGRTPEDIAKVATEAGLGEYLVKELISYRTHSHSDGFPGFHLANNKAEINRLKGRVVELSAKVKILDVESKVMATFDGGHVVENYGEDRIQLVFEGRPTEEMKAKLKGHGFRWSPTQGAWQRQLTRNAIGDVKSITNTWETYGKEAA